MKITAQTENDFLIEATEKEIGEILTSVNGEPPETIRIGQKIPAIDYASTIRKLKELKDSYEFKNLFSRIEAFEEETKKLKEAVLKANDIDL